MAANKANSPSQPPAGDGMTAPRKSAKLNKGPGTACAAPWPGRKASLLPNRPARHWPEAWARPRDRRLTPVSQPDKNSPTPTTGRNLTTRPRRVRPPKAIRTRSTRPLWWCGSPHHPDAAPLPDANRTRAKAEGTVRPTQAASAPYPPTRRRPSAIPT